MRGVRKSPGVVVFLLTAIASCSGKEKAKRNEGYLTGNDGTRLFYQVAGAGRDTVVVVHGGPGAGIQAIRPDLEPLTRNHLVIFYDQRGGGRSELPDTTLLGPNDFVNDLEAVRQHFQLATMNLLAHSFGAIIVGQYATSHADRIARLVFLGATGPSLRQAAPFYRAQMTEGDTATAHLLSLTLRSLLEGTATDPIAACRQFESLTKRLVTARGEFAGWQSSQCAMPAEAVRYSFHYTERLGPEGFGAWDFTHSLRSVAAPLLIIDGSRDTNGLPMERAWARALPNARLLTVEAAGRAVHAERPEIVFPAIDTFLSGSWPPGAITPE